MLNLVRAWIVLSTVLVAAGWGLSAINQLNRKGYAVVLGALALAGFFWLRNLLQQAPLTARWCRGWTRFRRRSRRALPLVFFCLALAVTLGAVLNPPYHTDAMQYRTPRVLHWLGAEHWHWIHTSDIRLNIVSCGFEWLTGPLLLFTRSDKWLFVINAASYLMLPGLIFAVFRRVGVRRHVAWSWMWILPAGWCFAMQAGGLGNDAFAAVYALASLDLAFRAKQKNSVRDLWLSFLACALLTGTKQTNVPLVLLWAIAAWPGLRLLRAHALGTSIVALVGLVISAVPMVYIDLTQTGAWTGFAKSQNLQPESPFWGVVGNAFVLTWQNLQPPIFPWYDRWNAALYHFRQGDFGAHFNGFEQFGVATRAVAEQNAALGLAVTLLLIVSVAVALWIRRAPGYAAAGRAGSRTEWLLRVLPWGLLLVFMAQVGSWNSGRYLAPYYPLLCPLVLAGRGHSELVRTRWWRSLALLAMLMTFGLIAVSRQRPVWPAQALTSFLQARFPHSHAVEKIRNAYGFFRECREAVDPLRALLPATETQVGYATHRGHLEVPLWLPVGSRRVTRVLKDDSPGWVRQLGIRYVILDHSGLEHAGVSVEQWLQKFGADVVGTANYRLQPDAPPEKCYLLRLRDARADS
jgi:hypothetical protein